MRVSRPATQRGHSSAMDQRRSMVGDYTCPYTFAQAHLPLTSATAGAAAEGAERAKKVKYAAF